MRWTLDAEKEGSDMLKADPGNVGLLRDGKAHSMEIKPLKSSSTFRSN